MTLDQRIDIERDIRIAADLGLRGQAAELADELARADLDSVRVPHTLKR